MDVFGDHSVCCSKNNIMRRHMVCQDSLVRLVHGAGKAARKEVGPGDGCRPADVFIPAWDDKGPVAVDCTLRHTLQPSDPLKAAARVHDWRTRQEGEKERLYGETCTRQGWEFLPFVVDLWGGLSPKASKFMNTIARLTARDLLRPRRERAEEDVWQYLSCQVARSIGRQLAITEEVTRLVDDDTLCSQAWSHRRDRQQHR